MKTKTFKDEKGIALVLSILLLLIVTLIGISAVNTTTFDLLISGNKKASDQAFYVAEAGINEFLGRFRSDATNPITDNTVITTPTTEKNPPWRILLAKSSGIGATKIGYGSSDPYTTSIPSLQTQLDFGVEVRHKVNAANEVITFNYNPVYIAKSYGFTSMAGATAVVETYLTMYGPWNNAIFAGEGANGGVINGNSEIMGSVHLLGTGLIPTDSAISMLGGGVIGNNYNGMDAALRALIPPIGSPESLDAELRVKRGKVELSGGGTVGKIETTSPNKDTVSGTYVTDGFGGNQGVLSVFSDNGTSNTYDLGDNVSFPSLNDPYGVYPTYAAYLKATAVYKHIGDLVIKENTADFSYNGIKWTKSTLTLEISGIVEVTGDIKIEKVTPGKDYIYKGKGTLYASDPSKSINIENNLLPLATDGGFPTNAIGFIAAGDINIGITSLLKAAGAFYAERQIVSNKQNQILGTFVTNYFDMRTQVPKIYQVPALARNLPPGMPGSKYFVKVNSWREVR